MTNMYHLQDGLWFGRLEDGSVRVVLVAEAFPDPSEEHPALLDITVSPAAWASVVASVSARGETGETHAEALAWHGGGA